MRLVSFLVVTQVLFPWVAGAQGLTGTLVGTVKDQQGGALVGALVEISSPALIGGPGTTTTNSKGQLRFTHLPPGTYGFIVAVQGFTTYRGQDVLIEVSTTTDIAVVLQVAGISQTVEVEGTSSRMGARNPGVVTRFGRGTRGDPDTKVRRLRRDQICTGNLSDVANEWYYHYDFCSVPARMRTRS